MVLLRADLSGNPPFRELLGQVRRTVLEALQHQDFPFPLLAERLRPAHEPGRNPIFQVSFGLQKAGPLERSLRMGGLALEPIGLLRRVTPFDLDWTIFDDGDGLRASAQYSPDLFDRESIERMTGHFATLLSGIVADVGQRLTDLPLVSD